MSASFPTRRAFTLGALAAPLVTTAAQAQTPPAPGGGAQTASAVLSTTREQMAIPAISAAVVRDGALIWTEAQGLADLELNTPATPEHLFRLGSVSKVVTAAIGARLAQAGVVDLDAPVSTYRPDLPDQHRATTLRQLYSHQGGVRHYDNATDFDFNGPGGMIDSRYYPTTEDVLALFIGDPLVAEPGTSSNYSTFGYTLISAVLESAAGAPFTDLIQSEVAAPLSLEELRADVPLEVIPGRASFYDLSQLYANALPIDIPLPDAPVLNAMAINPAYKWAGGGMVASARDLARFGAAHLDGDYLTAATRAMVFRPVTEATGESPALGLGWRIDADETMGRRFHHAGAIQGGRAQLALYPDHGMAVSLLSNLGYMPGDSLNRCGEIAAGFLS